MPFIVRHKPSMTSRIRALGVLRYVHVVADAK
jgi:hypothetical protein